MSARPPRRPHPRHPPPAPAAASRGSRRTAWGPIAIIVAAGALAYANSLSGPFVFDDTVSIVENASIRDWRDPAVLSPPRELPTSARPLVNLSFAINYALGGSNVGGYHLWNLAAHLVCGVLLFACIRRTLELPRLGGRWQHRSRDIAFAAAAIWTVHPLNSEVVDYLTQRTESMMAAFYLLAIYANARSAQSPRPVRWQAAAVVSCLLGMGCKESMVTAPVMIVLYDAVFVVGSFTAAMRRRWRYYALLAATWIGLAVLASGGPRLRSAGFSAGVDTWTYLLNQAVMITHYLRLAVWPSPLVLQYGTPRALSAVDVLPYALLIVSLAVGTIVAMRRSPPLGFLGAWFFVTLAPASSVVPIATEVGAERRMYLPLAGLTVLAVLGAVWLFERTRRPRAIEIAALAAVAAVLAAGTIRRNRDYRSALDLARTVLDGWPSPFAEAMLGQELAIAGRHDEAIVHLRAAAPGYLPARYHLGGELFNAGRFSEAVPELERFVRDAPERIEVVTARTMLGRALMLQQQWPGAETQLRLVLTMAPPGSAPYITALGYLAETVFVQQRFDEASSLYRTYVDSRPNDAIATTNLAVSLSALGKDRDALAAFRRAVDLNPGDAAARHNLDLTLESMRRPR